MKIKRILVPLDGSDVAKQALPHAVSIAQRNNATILLLRVVPLQSYAALSDPNMVLDGGTGATAYDYEMVRELQEQGHETAVSYLNEKQSILEQDGISCETIVTEGDEAGVIVDTAVEQQADVIVMTTHGRSGLSRWMMGSVAERVLRDAKCPVMVTRHNKQAQNILIPLDGSDLSEQALPVGLMVAEANNATAHLMRVHESSSESAQTAVQAYLDGCVAKQMATSKRGMDVEMKTAVVHGSPASSIIDYVEENEIDLIVIATHGRRGVHRWVYGSVTEKILRGVERNILVVRPQ